MTHQRRMSGVFRARIQQGFEAASGTVEEQRADGGILSEHAIQITWFAAGCRASLVGEPALISDGPRAFPCLAD